MVAAANKLRDMKAARDSGKAAYNYREDKSNYCWDLIQECPCPKNVLVNTKQLERVLRFCKALLKN